MPKNAKAKHAKKGTAQKAGEKKTTKTPVAPVELTDESVGPISEADSEALARAMGCSVDLIERAKDAGCINLARVKRFVKRHLDDTLTEDDHADSHKI